ncbi:Uncharacterised protein [Klebsiella variicola]|nr:Uncharacterised protein [Klebsiella variicola]
MRTRFSLRLSPFTSFPFSQARKHNWPEYSLWDLGPICIVGQLICLGPRSHLRRRSGYLLGPRSHLHRRSGYLPGTTVPLPSLVRLSAGTMVPLPSLVRLSAGTTVPLPSPVRLSAGTTVPPPSSVRYLPGTTVPLPSLVRLSAGTTVPPPSSVRLSAWDHGPTSVVGQVICLGPRSHLHRRHIISLGQRFNQCLSRTGIGLSPSTR